MIEILNKTLNQIPRERLVYRNCLFEVMYSIYIVIVPVCGISFVSVSEDTCAI